MVLLTGPDVCMSTYTCCLHHQAVNRYVTLECSASRCPQSSAKANGHNAASWPCRVTWPQQGQWHAPQQHHTTRQVHASPTIGMRACMRMGMRDTLWVQPNETCLAQQCKLLHAYAGCFMNTRRIQGSCVILGNIHAVCEKACVCCSTGSTSASSERQNAKELATCAEVGHATEMTMLKQCSAHALGAHSNTSPEAGSPLPGIRKKSFLTHSRQCKPSRHDVSIHVAAGAGCTVSQC
jgi:hypothetical protein